MPRRPEKQQIELPLVYGQNERIDEKVAPLGVLKTLRNMYYSKDGRLVTRNGYPALGDSTLSGGSALGAGSVRLAQRGGELLGLSSTAVWQYIVDEGAWNRRTAVSDDSRPTEATRAVSAPVVRDHSANINNSDMATGGGYILHAWSAADYQIGYMIEAVDTGTEIARDQEHATGGLRVRCWSSGDYLYAGWVESATTSLIVDRWDVTDISAAPTRYTPLATLDATFRWDVHVTAEVGQEIATFTDDVSGNYVLNLWNESFAAQASAPIATGAVTVLSVAVWGAAGEDVYVAYQDSTNGLRAQAFALPGATGGTGSVVLDATATSHWGPVVIGRSTATSATYYWPTPDTPGTPGTVTISKFKRSDMDNTGTVTGGPVITGGRPASKPFTPANVPWMWVTHDNDGANETGLQRQYILSPVDGTELRPQARVNFQDAAGSQGSNALTYVAGFVVNPTGSVYQWDAERVYFGSIAYVTSQSFGTDSHAVTLSDRKLNLAAEVSGVTAFAAGIPWSWDGDQCMELGFLHSPDNVDAQTNGAGALTGVYKYTAVYEYWDAEGNKHVSGAIASNEITLAANAVRVYAPNLTLTMLRGERDVRISFYRTTAGGSVYHYLSSTPSLLGSPVVPYVDDNTNDTVLTRNPIIYTASGQLNNVCPPGSSHHVFHRDRLFLCCGNDLWFSHSIAPELAPDFSPVNYIHFSETLLGVASMDDALIVFTTSTENPLYVVYGDGPSRTGAGSFNPPQRLPSSEPCTDPRSIVVFRDGVVYRTARSIEVLPRGLGAPQPIGHDVQDTLATYPTVTSAVSITGDDRWWLKFTCVGSDAVDADSIILLYDFDRGQWSEENHNPSAMNSAGTHVGTVWNGEHVISLVNTGLTLQQGSAYAEYSTSTGSNDGRIVPVIETQRISPFGLGGWGRVYNVVVDGEQIGDHNFILDVTLDDHATYPTSSGRFWNNTDAAGTPFSYQLDMFTQRMGFLGFKIWAVPTGTSGSFSLSTLTLEVAQLPGARRVAPADRR